MSSARNRKGFTLAETLVSVGIFSFLILVLYGTIKTGTAVYFKDSMLLGLQQEARNGMERIVREVRQSSGSAITVLSATSDRITFSTPTKVNVSYYLSGGDLVREFPTGTIKSVSQDVTYLKFSKTGSQLMVSLKSQSTAYGQTLTFALEENIKLRNE